jgi:general secretion pathway protein D
MKNIFVLWFLIVFGITVSFASLNTLEKKPALPKLVKLKWQLWNLKNADILDVIHEISQETGKNFVVSPKVHGKLTIISSKPISSKEVYQVFLTMINVLGYSAIDNGKTIKILPNADAVQSGVPVNLHQGNEVTARVLPLRNISAPQMIPILRSLIPSWSRVSAYMPGNVLVLSGPANTLKSVADIVSQVDSAAEKSIMMVNLRYAQATDVVNILKSIQRDNRMHGAVDQYSVVADTNNNRILISGKREERLKMRLLIQKLDRKATASGNEAVIFLHYQKSVELAKIIKQLAEDQKKSDQSKGSASSGFTAVHVVAEPNINALILSGPQSKVQAYKNIIKKLDIQPSEVLVQAVIAEVNEGELYNLGIEWGLLDSTKASTSSTTDSSGESIAQSLFTAGVGIIVHGRLQNIIHALKTQTGTNLLSTPSIMILDNQKGSISVGKEVPRQSGSYATSNNVSTVSPFTVTKMEKVALTLNVTPQINLANAIRLKLDLTNDSLENPKNPGLNFIKNTSKISNTVIVNNGDILVLGGVMSNTEQDSVQSLPILGSIPLIGKLFQYKITQKDKKMLVVFIKPSIARSSDQLALITENKYKWVRELEKQWRYGNPYKIQHMSPNVLPAWKGDVTLPPPFSG